MDVDPKYLPEDTSFYMLNTERNLSGVTGILGKTTPLAANKVMCELEHPGGENYSIGSHNAILVNETYDWVFNSNNTHYIKRIKSNAECEIVYHDPCLELSADPKHSIEQWRAGIRLEKVCANRHGKYLTWACGLENIGYLDVEASIATKNFTTPFFDICPNPCAYWQLCVPQPCGCLTAEWVPLPDSEVGLTNHLVDVGVKVMYRQIYYDLRATEWSDPSSLYFQDSKGCFDNSLGFSRCLKMRIPVGNPMVNQIEVGYSLDNGVTWILYDTIEKYKKYNSTQQYWYERDLSEQVSSTFSEEDCSFDYFFCNDKQCQPIDPAEIVRVFNPMPRFAQGFIRIKDSYGFYNYITGNCPLDKTEIDKFNIGINCDASGCDTEYATITVRAVIYNFEHNRMQFVYRLGGANDSVPDDVSDTAMFGGLQPALDGGFDTGYDQEFKQKTRNFIVYVDATEYWAQMKQWYSDASFANVYETGIISAMDSVKTKNRFRRAAQNGEFLYQEAKIKVRKGTKGFLRLASQKSVGNDQDTSTYVLGVLDDLRDYKGNQVSSYDNTIEDIYFDTCDGDVTLTKAFLIQDNAVDNAHSTSASAYYGYIKDANGKPVPGATLFYHGSPMSITDFNGFYHFYLFAGVTGEIQIDIEVETSCSTSGGFSIIESFLSSGQAGASTQKDYTITSLAYKNGFYAIVKQPVNDCDGEGVGGIRVSMSGAKYAITDGLGIATFHLRNYPSRDRIIRSIAIDHNGCFTQNCSNGCDACMPTNVSSTTVCYQSKPEILLPPFVFNKASATQNKVGLKAGGNYPFGIVVKWPCDKISAVYEIRSINIPKTQEKGRLGFCSFTYDATGMVLPEGAECIDIVRGLNINNYELQWIVDSIQKTGNGKIKLTIQSLNDYNAKYKFKTNTVYQWIKGDRVEFIRNGDGNILTTAINGLLNYLTVSPFNDEIISGVLTTTDANYFNQLLIDDDGRLDAILPGSIIELQRPKECQEEPTYYGICATIPIGADRRLTIPIGTFTTFDTFLVPRQIDYTDATGNKINLPSQLFEHRNPSDFWGTDIGMSDIGKAYFVNKFENERRFGRNISLNASGQFNYFGDLVKTLPAPEQGDLTAMFILDAQVIIGIGEFDSLLAQSSDDILKLGADNVIRAVGVDNIISDGVPKIIGQFGCQYPHIGSVYFGDGYAQWCDVNKSAYVTHDYNVAVDSSLGKMQTYFKRRFRELQANNEVEVDFLNHYRFSTGLNGITGALALTIKKLRHSGVNNDHKPFISPNTTTLYHPATKDYLGFASFTQESYSTINLINGVGCAFISYLNGVPYLHPVIPEKFNEFNGVAVDRVVGIAINKYPEKIKIPISGEIQDDTMWFVEDVVTTDTNFRSEVPAIKMAKKERNWKFSFLKDINSRGGLFSGNNARDYAILVTMVRDNTDALKYGTIDDAKRVLFDELDLITFKWELSEQSGMTENL